MTESVTIGSRRFRINSGDGEHFIPYPYVMGILNVTPDSFSDGGRYTDIDKALRRTEQMLGEGADIIDVGGESTRPGYVKISAAEEIERTCFVIEAIKERFDVPVSLDTYKYDVAKAGLLAGADLINDIWGLRYDDRMAALIAKFGVPCCLMHNRDGNLYGDLINDVTEDIKESIGIALAAGIKAEKIIIDPGIGFAKNTKQSLVMLSGLDKLTALGYPILLGTSKKSVIGDTLGLPVDERGEGTIATSVMGLMKGCSFFRVHDVKANVRALKMTYTVMREELEWHG